MTRLLSSTAGIKLLTSAAFRPKGNGVNESGHQLIRASVCAACLKGEKDLDAIIKGVCRAHNSVQHKAKNVSPYEALFGRPPKLPTAQEYEHVLGEARRQERLEQLLGERIYQQAARNCTLRGRQSQGVRIGDLVVVRRHLGGSTDTAQVQKGEPSQTWLRPKWSPPITRNTDQMRVVLAKESDSNLSELANPEERITRALIKHEENEDFEQIQAEIESSGANL